MCSAHRLIGWGTSRFRYPGQIPKNKFWGLPPLTVQNGFTSWKQYPTQGHKTQLLACYVFGCARRAAIYRGSLLYMGPTFLCCVRGEGGATNLPRTPVSL